MITIDEVPDHEAIHHWFNLTYANYLIVPRSMLQSMPDEWQKKFVTLLNEMQETLDIDDAPGDYMVRARDGNKFIHDPYSDYRRGSRKIPRKKP